MWEIGFVIGGLFGLLGGVTIKRSHILRTSPEEDLIKEVKRRRVEAALARQAQIDAEKEISKL